jgi:polyisoprenoid-binding protein YceI
VADATSRLSQIPAGRWTVDTSRSSVVFTLKHMMFATVTGRFHDFEGVLETSGGAPRASGVVKASSIDTSERVRDEHLRRSADFFDVERYPEIAFNSTRIDCLNRGQLRIVGDLTMRDIAREIALDAWITDARREDGGEERIELALRGELNRRVFGLTWNQAVDTGGALLGNKVKIALELSAVKR